MKKIRVLCPYCKAARLLNHTVLERSFVSCVKSSCRRLFAVIHNGDSISVYGLDWSESYKGSK